MLHYVSFSTKDVFATAAEWQAFQRTADDEGAHIDLRGRVSHKHPLGWRLGCNIEYALLNLDVLATLAACPHVDLVVKS